MWLDSNPHSGVEIQTRAFLNAAPCTKKLRGKTQTPGLPVGNNEKKEEENLVQARNYDKMKVFAVNPCAEELSLYCSNVEKQMTAGLQHTSELQAHLAHTIIIEEMGGLRRIIAARLRPTLLEAAMPICSGFASAWTWWCLDGLEASSEGQGWLQGTWDVPCETWRPLLLKVQSARYKVVDMCALMVGRLVSRCPAFSSDSSQLTAVLCKVRHRVHDFSIEKVIFFLIYLFFLLNVHHPPTQNCCLCVLR
ncbi:LOW QUALITY PROTEIN: uncharacterized protein ACNS7B_006966 [Menidia menidia]